MRDEKEERKKQARSKNNKAKQHSTPKAVTLPRKNELPRVGLEPTTLYTLDRALHVRSCIHSIIRNIVLLCKNRISFNRRGFVLDNFAFFSALLMEIIGRSFQLDLTSDHGATLLFRVTKVYTHSLSLPADI